MMKIQIWFKGLMRRYRHSNPYSRNLFLVLVVILAGYAVFFTSHQWMPKSANGSLLTPLNEPVTYEGREFTIRRWDYCESEQTMEIELDIANSTFDGLDSYSYYLRTRTGDEIQGYRIAPVVETPRFLVLQAKQIPAGFQDVALYIQIADPNADHDYLTVYTNNTAIGQAGTLPEQTEPEYRKNRITREIRQVQDTIDKNNAAITETQEKISRIKAAIAEIEADKIYQSSGQIEESDKQIAAYMQQQKDAEATVKELEQENQELKEKIYGLEQAREAIK